MLDFNKLPAYPFNVKDRDGDIATILGMAPDGRTLVGYLKGSTGYYSMHYHDHDGITLVSPVDQARDWFNDSANIHFKMAVDAFMSLGKKINGIKFIRSVVPRSVTNWAPGYETEVGMGLNDAKTLYENVEARGWYF